MFWQEADYIENLMLNEKLMLTRSWCWWEVGADEKLVLMRKWCWWENDADKKFMPMRSWCWWELNADEKLMLMRGWCWWEADADEKLMLMRSWVQLSRIPSRSKRPWTTGGATIKLSNFYLNLFTFFNLLGASNQPSISLSLVDCLIVGIIWLFQSDYVIYSWPPSILTCSPWINSGVFFFSNGIIPNRPVSR